MEFGKPDHEETEEERTVRHNREEFMLKINGSSQNVQDKYYKLLEEERKKKIVEMKREGRKTPAIVGLEERENLLNRAEAIVRIGADPIKMEHDFERFNQPTKGSEPSSNFEPDDEKPL